ncbi:MAG: hypothetical protein COA58_03575 [Bacteroidetes bacterium]|nr:MAG: hypothetical protein COA58_03575 [Bacteroidota bacterium]
MKKVILTLAILAFLSGFSFAQEQTSFLKLKGIKGDLGLSWDRYQNMSLDWMKARTAQDGAFTDDLRNMEESEIFYSSLGGNIGTQLLFTAPSLGNEKFIPEVRLGLSMTLGKEAIVDYTNSSFNFDPYSTSSTDYNSLMYCFVENETRVNAEVVWRVGDQKKVTFYGGLGTNISASFDNDLFVFDDYYNNRTFAGNNFEAGNGFNSTESVFKGKSVFYQRLYIPIGLDLKMFKHLQGTIEYKLGGGLEEVVGGAVSTFRTGEFNFGMRLNIAQNNTTSILDYLR